MPSLRLLRALMLVVPLLLAGGSARAAADAFSVKGVEVDVSAANVQAAKDQAIAEAQARAFQQLLERLTSPADHARLPKADGTQYVRDFTVEQERALANRYIATLSVRFNGAAVKRLLQAANIAYAEPRSRALVVVPVFQAPGSRPVLWDEPNPWRAAWLGLGGGGLVPLVVPPGDIGDVQVLTVDQALAGEPNALAALGTRWRSPEVLVVAAGLAANGKSLDVSTRATPGAPKPFDSLSYTLAEGENVDSMLARAARDIARAIDTIHKQPNLLQFDRAGTLSTLVPLSGLQDWLAVRERLGRVTQVRRWELVSLSKAEAALVLHIVGDQDQVKGALAQAGLALEWGDGFWTMRPTGGKP